MQRGEGKKESHIQPYPSVQGIHYFRTKMTESQQMEDRKKSVQAGRSILTWNYKRDETQCHEQQGWDNDAKHVVL